MSKMRVETRDPWAFLRERDDINGFGYGSPKTRATMSVPTTQAVGIGWWLFWNALWGVIRRRKSIDFWMEGES